MDLDFLDVTKAKDLTTELKLRLLSKNIIFRRQHIFVFICGGAITGPHFLRTKFLTYAKTDLKDYNFILAEKCLQTKSNNQRFSFRNIAFFEDNLAHLSNCTLIFPESPGSFAEVGYFANNNAIAEKTLIVNLVQYQEDSFLLLGPIDIISQKTQFTPHVNLNDHSPQADFKHIATKLERVRAAYSRMSSSRIPLINVKFKDHPKDLQLMVILKIIDLFRKISIKDLQDLMTEIFGYVSHDTIDNFLGILEQCEFIDVTDVSGHLLLSSKNVDTGIRIQDLDETNFKLRATEFVSKRYEV